MDLPGLVAFVKARLGLLALIAAVAGVIALGVSLVQPDRFRASVDLSLATTTGAASLVAAETGVTTATGAQAADVALATLDTAAARVARRLPGDASADELERAVDVRFQGDSGRGTVTAESSTPADATRIANAFAGEIVALQREAARADIGRAIDTVRRLIAERTEASGAEAASAAAEIGSLTGRLARLRILDSLQRSDVEAVEPAPTPREASSPKPLRNALFASSVALVVALCVLILLARVDTRVRDEDELAALFETDVLVRIPRARSKRLGAAHDPAVSEAFQFLCLRLQLMRPEDGCLVVTVTSLGDGDGKTTVVSRLADALASGGADVVALDLDPGSPGLPAQAGVDVRRRIKAPADAPLDFGRLQRMLEQMRDGTDYVLLDAAPVLSAPDASAAAAAADGVILVVDMDEIRGSEPLAAKRQLANSRATVLGIVLNRAPARSHAIVPRRRASTEPEPTGPFGPQPFMA
jgi:capsular polysaccharide biosynthesis protein